MHMHHHGHRHRMASDQTAKPAGKKGRCRVTYTCKRRSLRYSRELARATQFNRMHFWPSLKLVASKSLCKTRYPAMRTSC